MKREILMITKDIKEIKDKRKILREQKIKESC